ncbi:J-domain-containing protein [Roseisalinus antarcticus]|uniref:DnaJ homologue subfamily C member 28 conserved domain-containing protein n=1 Tax=Roseisalinus antarcticus TaxID=254357 RepID=A0A1Y5T1X7_9RHOB|nr:DUF1992 domain-containing protein [Roseisalinus antarcticus]SLN50247.1 hypothetical protein ROA7023_02168 [Roseisalinus antarcticus]
MSFFLARIAERLIECARDEGRLSNLKGEHRPLDLPSGNPHVDVMTEVGHRVMAENGAIPPEVVMRKSLAEARDALKSAIGEAERRTARSRVADLELRCNMAAEARMRRR